jgi:hypothetical protein
MVGCATTTQHRHGNALRRRMLQAWLAREQADKRKYKQEAHQR